MSDNIDGRLGAAEKELGGDRAELGRNEFGGRDLIVRIVYENTIETPDGPRHVAVAAEYPEESTIDWNSLEVVNGDRIAILKPLGRLSDVPKILSIEEGQVTASASVGSERGDVPKTSDSGAR